MCLLGKVSMLLQVICWIPTYALGHISTGVFTPSCMTGFPGSKLQSTFSILVPMFLRLAVSHEQLLVDKQAAAENAEDVVKPQQAALVWQLICR